MWNFLFLEHYNNSGNVMDAILMCITSGKCSVCQCVSVCVCERERELGREGGRIILQLAFLGKSLLLKSFKQSCIHWAFIGSKDYLPL